MEKELEKTHFFAYKNMMNPSKVSKMLNQANEQNEAIKLCPF